MSDSARNLRLLGLPVKRRTIFLLLVLTGWLSVAFTSCALLAWSSAIDVLWKTVFLAGAMITLPLALYCAHLIRDHGLHLFLEEARWLWPVALAGVIGITGGTIYLALQLFELRRADVAVPLAIGTLAALLVIVQLFLMQDLPRTEQRARNGATSARRHTPPLKHKVHPALPPAPRSES